MANGVGPYTFSLAYELTGTYNTILYLFSLIIVCFAIALMTVEEPRKKTSKAFEVIEQDTIDTESNF